MSTPNTPLPPDVAAVRNQRINSDLISAFKRPVPPDTTPYITGVGLYTHIERLPPQDAHAPSPPVFFPLDPPPPRSQTQRSPLPPAIQNVWEELCAVMKEEEQSIGQMELGLVALKSRYESSDAPERSHPPVEEGEVKGAGRVVTAEKEPELLRRRSSGFVSGLTAGIRDVSMGGHGGE
ncbi:hypothetical protein GMOD_00009857 [Pyrenophora seminiperda CCB06]|uniref:Uncharacterized protein n=1 Tax=Pyrenophora seminiperda CCB06 TaxID=1302712 RepID=A0A3M7MEB6_9PLEO|nr:hypothetical protein GMOD_00009857 [Pyrenophora seminiperda CCB06]